MSPTVAPAIFDNPAWAKAKPRLSVLIPFWRDDPCALLAALAREADATAGAVEAVLLDDGSGDAELAGRVRAAVAVAPLPARFVRLAANEGRARGRNHLAAQARAEAFLFLDSDMRPDSETFLQTWLALAEQPSTAVAFGGFSLAGASRDRAFAVHRRMSSHAECLPASVRRLQPEKYVYTSNLLVRRAVFEAEGFDAEFAGWGWEDVEWAMRVARRFPVLHLDNPAAHLGLDTVERLAGKYEQSVANFARVAAKHPEVLQTYPSWRAARALSRAPGLKLWRPWLKRAAKVALLPPATRAFSLRLYRAALYAEAV